MAGKPSAALMNAPIHHHKHKLHPCRGQHCTCDIEGGGVIALGPKISIMTDLASPRSTGGGGMAMPSTGDYVDLHELAKGWKAAIARAKDPATRFVYISTSSDTFICFPYFFLLFIRCIYL
jgi:hypothetical protein